MNVSLPDALKAFVDVQVSQRGYGTSSEYVRELIRKDQERQHLRGLLLECAASAPAGRQAARISRACVAASADIAGERQARHSACVRQPGCGRGHRLYLDESAAQAALGLVDALERAYSHIARHPATGSARYALELNLPGLRSWPLKRYPYLVFYVERADHIDVWRVLHAQRDIPA